MGPPGESTAADREHELAGLRVLAEAADAWARWRRQGSDDPAGPEELKLLAALDRFASAGGQAGRNLLVICSGCRRTRDGTEWVELETFLTETAGIEFTHSLCPNCLGQLYPHHPAEPD
jgi:hypothetical protein